MLINTYYVQFNMEVKKLNARLIIGAIFLMILTSLLGYVVGGPNPIIFLHLLWIAIGIFGAVNFTEWKMWIKIIVTIVTTPE